MVCTTGPDEGTTVLTDSPAFRSFSADDPDMARTFYEQTLGLPVALIAWFCDPAGNVFSVMQEG